MSLLAEWIQHKKELVNVRTEHWNYLKTKKQNKNGKHSICEKQISQPKMCLYGDLKAAKEEILAEFDERHQITVKKFRFSAPHTWLKQIKHTT